MSSKNYVIKENFADRQKLLADMLNPLTLPVFDHFSSDAIRQILDVGCGYGHTTSMLAKRFPEATNVIGFELNQELVASASVNHKNEHNISFQQGDASIKFPYPDHHFDLTFTRYLLCHVPTPASVIDEMVRVTRPGGFIVAFEPNSSGEFCKPHKPVTDSISRILNEVIPHHEIGKELARHFVIAGTEILGKGLIRGKDTTGLYHLWYASTMEAVRDVAIKKNLITSQDYEVLLDDLKSLQTAPLPVFHKFPDRWIVVQKHASAKLS